MDGEEPSMEDILASIRKIISDDEVSEPNLTSPEDVKSDDTIFDVEDMGLSNDSDFDFEAVSKNDPKSTVELTNPENNLLVEEFDSDELDTLLSFDELEIPDIDQPNIDLNEGDSLPSGQLVENTTLTAEATDDVSVLDTLDLIGQSEAGESVSLNLDASDLDPISSDTLQLNNVELENSFDDISALNDLDALMDEELDLTSITDSNVTGSNANEIHDDEGIDLSELNFAFDDDLTSQGETDASKTNSSSLEESPNVQKASTETDIDLVKSLMADLTDDSFFDEDTPDESSHENSDDDVDMPSSVSLEALVTDETNDESPLDVQSFEDDDEAAVMDEILSMAMDNETGVEVKDGSDVSLEEEPPALDISDTDSEESERLLEMDDENSDDPDQIVEDDEINTLIDDNLKVASTTSGLQEIARRAANSADEAELSEPRESMLSRVWDKMDAAIGSEVHGENVNSEEDNTLESDNVEAMEDIMSDDADDIVEQAENPANVMSAIAETDKLDSLNANLSNEFKETTEMPKAIRSETILNEVTEKATIGAFAELNHVVEEKAIYEERGARIGDLVQEALRPMLKEWLDANLKGIVERAVAKEVKRISTGK